jgi:outer membrane protein OmpA-like peptidoglycan-associated protein
MKQTKTVMALAFGMVLSSIAIAQADDMVKNYVRSSDGSVVKDGSGDCVRTTDMTDVRLEECGYATEVVVEKTPEATTVKMVEKEVVLAQVVIPNLQFAFDSAELTADSKAILDQAVADLTPYKESFRAQTSSIDIKGYTDTSGPEAYNLKLSERRANAVADYLADGLGVDRSRMVVTGMGEADPVADNATRAGRIKNRRVEVNVIKK